MLNRYEDDSAPGYQPESESRLPTEPFESREVVEQTKEYEISVRILGVNKKDEFKIGQRYSLEVNLDFIGAEELADSQLSCPLMVEIYAPEAMFGDHPNHAYEAFVLPIGESKIVSFEFVPRSAGFESVEVNLYAYNRWIKKVPFTGLSVV